MKLRLLKQLLQPDLYYSHVVRVDLEYLSSLGIKGLICDLDNTLLDWNSVEIYPAIENWLAEALELGFKTCILSNSLQSRVRDIANTLELPAIGSALKPRRKAFELAIEQLDMESNQIAVIGDQIFTDIIGGNRLELLTILVEPLAKQELWSTKVIRLLERQIKKELELTRGDI
ncbi:MAG: YqeG family HAD IIIA-type phosphatase [Bacillota bacterium]